MLKRSANLQTIMKIGFFLRVIIAAWNGFYGPSFGADADAASLHHRGSVNAQGVEAFRGLYLRTTYYTNSLGVVYSFTTDSLFLGSLLSCAAWLASASLLIKSMRLLSVDELIQYKALLVYALIPSSILYTSVTLREPYQLLFVNLMLYSALKIYLNKSAKHWLVLFCAIAGMGVLHGTLLAFGLYTVVATLVLVSFRGRKMLTPERLIFVAPIVALVAYYGLSLFMRVSYNLESGLDSAIESYQHGLLGTDARANYKTSSEASGIGGLLSFVPVSLFQLMFEPMPWRISTISDLVALFENILRVWLLRKAWVGLRNMPVQGRKPVIFVFISYLVIETIWSIGTINWGTATRHHIPGIGLLVVAAYAYWGKPGKKRMVGT